MGKKNRIDPKASYLVVYPPLNYSGYISGQALIDMIKRSGSDPADLVDVEIREA